MRNVGRADSQRLSDDGAVPASDPITLNDELKAKLNAVSTATLTGQLQNRGIRSTFLSGLRPIKEGQRMVGIAHTLRYVPIAKTSDRRCSPGRTRNGGRSRASSPTRCS